MVDVAWYALKGFARGNGWRNGCGAWWDGAPPPSPSPAWEGVVAASGRAGVPVVIDFASAVVGVIPRGT